jgi:hypothetical protein
LTSKIASGSEVADATRYVEPLNPAPSFMTIN